MINKTDVVFGLSTLAGLTTLIMKTGGTLLTNTETLWFGLISGCLAFLAYAFYDYFEGMTPPPTPPTPNGTVFVQTTPTTITATTPAA